MPGILKMQQAARKVKTNFEPKHMGKRLIEKLLLSGKVCLIFQCG